MNIDNIEFFLGDLKASNYNLSFIESVENLIQENKEMKNKCNELNFKYTAQWVDDNFIPKSKIKEKKEELEKEYKILQQTSDFIIADTIQPKIEVLQELLEEGDENNGSN